MSRIIGYARVSTEDQNLDLQKIAIEKYAEEQGLELILYVEKISTRKTDRTELQHALKAAPIALGKLNTLTVYPYEFLSHSSTNTF